MQLNGPRDRFSGVDGGVSGLRLLVTYSQRGELVGWVCFLNGDQRKGAFLQGFLVLIPYTLPAKYLMPAWMHIAVECMNEWQ